MRAVNRWSTQGLERYHSKNDKENSKINVTKEVVMSKRNHTRRNKTSVFIGERNSENTGGSVPKTRHTCVAHEKSSRVTRDGKIKI